MIVADRLKGRKTLQVSNFLDEFEKDDIKKEVDIIILFHHFGITLTKKGKSFLGLCPWHEDKNPSLSVDRGKGLYNCFGCGESGDIFTLTEKMKGCDFRESAVYLKDFAGKNIKPNDNDMALKPAAASGAMRESGHKQKNKPGSKNKDNKTKNITEPKTVDTATGEIMARNAEPAETKKNGNNEKPAQVSSQPLPAVNLTTVAEYYHKRLYENKKAYEYLKQRGLKRPEVYARFKIGFSDGSLLEKISDTQKKELIQQGIITEKGREHFRDCLTFPIFDDMDTVVGMYGRSINDPSTGSGTGSKVKHLYLKGKHKSVFNRKSSKVYDEIILTESIIDCLSLVESGFENVQSIYGTNGFTDEHLQILKDDRVKTIILAFDADEAGKEASEKLKEKLLPEGFAVKIITSPVTSQNGKDVQCKDWNEYLASGSNAGPVKSVIEKTETFKPQEEKDFKAEKNDPGHIFTTGDVTYRVTGVKEMFVSNLRVRIKAEMQGTDERYYDTLDLYSARSRAGYSRNLSGEFYLEQKRIDKDLIKILEYLERERDRNLMSESGEDKEIRMTEEEIALGMELLKSPDLFDRVVRDMEILGYVGEDRNKKLMFITAHSYQSENPFTVVVRSRSASGKSALIETIEDMMPPERVLSVSSFSDKALNYAKDLDRKFLTISEMVHKEEIEYQLRDIQSKHKLSRLLTTKDLKTGDMDTKCVETKAYTSIAMTTTEIEINQENASRCFIITVNESSEQTARVLRSQKKKFKLEGREEKEYDVPIMIKQYIAAGRLLKPYVIIIPYVDDLRFPERFMRARRDHDRFLYLIAGTCHIYQYQKDVKQYRDIIYIEADVRDYELAYDQLVNNNLLSNLTDISQEAHDLYEHMRELAGKTGKKKGLKPDEVSMTQRDIREFTTFDNTWVKRHLRILVDYEYVIIVSGGGARTKGHYRIVADEPIEKIDIAAITTPDELREILRKKKNGKKQT